MQQIKKMAAALCSLLVCMAMLLIAPGVTVLAADSQVLSEPAHRKWVADNGDGTYTLTLNVTGEVKEEARKAADVLVIMDTSGSMRWSVSGFGGESRLNRMKELVGKMADKLLYANSSNRMAVVRFSKEASTLCNWTSSQQGVKNALAGVVADGGTNWHAGLRQASSLFSNNDAAKYVIFVSDGNPNYYYDSRGRLQGDGNGYSQDAFNAAVTEAKSLANGKTLYSVGVGGSVDRMKSFAQSTNSTYYDGKDDTALDNAFADILEQIVHSYKKITITDTLSEYVQMAGNVSDITVKATDANGTAVTIPDAIKNAIRIEYTAENKKLTVTFPEDYALEQGVTYSVSFLIAPTDYAKQIYALDGKYPHTGEEETGESSAGKAGFYSNTEAILGYNGVSCGYNQPVVQVSVDPIRQLPAAGGSGIGIYIGTGAAILGIAATILVIRKRRKQTETLKTYN